MEGELHFDHFPGDGVGDESVADYQKHGIFAGNGGELLGRGADVHVEFVETGAGFHVSDEENVASGGRQTDESLGGNGEEEIEGR